EYGVQGKEKRKKLVRVKQSSEIQAVFFDLWRQEHPNVALEEVPADMVTTSGSGLDPHITLHNAEYQLKHRVAAARASKIVRDAALQLHKDFDALDEKQRQEIENQARRSMEVKVGRPLEDSLNEIIGKMLHESASAPLGGLAGVPLINVLEINLAMDQRLKRLVETGK